MTIRSALIRSVALVAALLAAVSPQSVRAQETAGRIQGTVVAEGTGQPLSRAQVMVRGTNIGSLTNEDGAYLFVGVPAGEHVVIVQLIGYGSREQTVNVPAGQTVTANFTLSQTAVALDEIVVTGTAAQVRRKEIGNSIATIGRAQIENMPIVNASDALAGRAPGVTFMTNSGQPGAGSTIKIRGINSVSQDAQPLIYVDGVRIANQPTRAGWGGRGFLSPLQDVAPEDIARVEIVKGAAATTLYGTEASNGVIQIFTKRGVSGDNSIWQAGISAGVNSGARWGTDADPSEQYVNCGRTDLLYGFDIDTGEREYFEDPTCPADGDWMRNGAITNYSLSVRGGTGNVTYFASGNFGREDGILPTQRSTDGGFRANVGFAPTSQLTFTLNNSYQKRDSRFVADGNNAEGFLLNVGRGANNYLRGGKGDECAAVSAEKTCVTNAYAFQSDNLATSDHFTSGLTVGFAPTENFTHRLTVGYDYTFINAETTLPFDYLTLPEGYYWDENTRHTKVSLDYTGSFENMFGESVASTFSWGGQLFRDRRRWTEFDVQSFAGPGEPTLESGAQLTYRADQLVSNTNAGVFLQEQIGLNDRLFVTAGLRVDGNSAFGEDFGLQPYPKLSLSYVLSDYDWWPTVAETFKLRAAIGESGKAPDAFDKVRTWRPVSGDDGEPGFSPLDIGNEEVGPERTREIEGGFDASFFNGRLGMEFTGFHARTIDALVPVVYPPSQGFLAERNENVGELVNKGLEFGLTAGLVRSARFDWQVRFNGTLLQSKVTDLDGGRPDTTRIYTGLNSYLIEGQPGPVYVQDRVMNPNEFAGPVVVRDTIIGQVYPNRMLGLATTLTFFNRLTLDALAEFQGGHFVQNYTAYQSARRGAWHPCIGVQEKLWAFTEEGDASALADVTALERARCAYIGQSPVAGETVRPSIGFWTEKGDFLKMRYISLTYEIPERFISFADAASLTLSARNLFTITDYTGADPEMTDAADASGNQPGGGEFGRRDYYQIPPSRAFLMALRFTF